MALLSQIILATVVAGVLSMLGGVLLLWRTTWVKRFSVHFISFAAGALLGAAFFDLLPEALELTEAQTESVLGVALAGLLTFFLIERLILEFHAHHPEDTREHRHATPQLLMVGDGFHNLIDGAAIAAAFLADPNLGIVTAIAVGLHEIPQEIGDYSLLIHHGWEKKKVLIVNLLVSLTSIVGALIAYWLRNYIEPHLPYLLAFTAGMFIYISASDLLPELSAGKTDRPSHVVLLLFAGIVVTWIFAKALGV